MQISLGRWRFSLKKFKIQFKKKRDSRKYFLQKTEKIKLESGPRNEDEGKEEFMGFSEIFKIILKIHFSRKNRDNFDNFD